MTSCEEWLRRFPAMYGSVSVDVIRDVRKTPGFTRAEVKEAKKALGVLTENGAGSTKTAGQWFRRLP